MSDDGIEQTESNEWSEDLSVEGSSHSQLSNDRIEKNFGDNDDVEENDVESRNQRRTKRNVRVEEGSHADVVMRPGSRTSRLNRQSSSEDEIALKTRSRTSSGTSEDGNGSRRSSRMNVKDRTASFELLSEQPSEEKRQLFSSRRSQTVAAPSRVEDRRTSFGRTRTASGDVGKLSRKTSAGRPDWSSSTKVDHNKIEKNTLSRKASSTTQSDNDEPKTTSQLKSRFESNSLSKDNVHKTKAFGGTTGAATLKAKFENPQAGFQRRTSSASRNRVLSTDEEDMGPKKVSASSLKARFEAKKNETEPVQRNFVIRKTGGAGTTAKKFNGSPVSNKCLVCTKTVYPLEKIEADGKMYHKFCFKCATCNRTVSLGSYAALEGNIYCKPHLKQLFKLKGNYDEGFGREQRKSDWIKKDESAISSDSTAALGDQIIENGHTAKDNIAGEGEDD